MMCLLSNTVLTSLKNTNANKHYLTQKDHKCTKLKEESYQVTYKKLKNGKL